GNLPGAGPQRRPVSPAGRAAVQRRRVAAGGTGGVHLLPAPVVRLDHVPSRDAGRGAAGEGRLPGTNPQAAVAAGGALGAAPRPTTGDGGRLRAGPAVAGAPRRSAEGGRGAERTGHPGRARRGGLAEGPPGRRGSPRRRRGERGRGGTTAPA